MVIHDLDDLEVAHFFGFHKFHIKIKEPLKNSFSLCVFWLTCSYHCVFVCSSAPSASNSNSSKGHYWRWRRPERTAQWRSGCCVQVQPLLVNSGDYSFFAGDRTYDYHPWTGKPVLIQPRYNETLFRSMFHSRCGLHDGKTPEGRVQWAQFPKVKELIKFLGSKRRNLHCNR